MSLVSDLLLDGWWSGNWSSCSADFQLRRSWKFPLDDAVDQRVTCFQPTPAFRQMQDDPPAGATEDGAASKDHGVQHGWLPVSRQASGALKLGEQVEEQQNALVVRVLYMHSRS